MKLTEKMWDDFLDMAVDSAGAAGWKWFEKEYGLTHESFKQLLVSNAEKAEKLDLLVIENQTILDTISQVKIANEMYERENKQLKTKYENCNDDRMILTNQCKEFKENFIIANKWATEQTERIQQLKKKIQHIETIIYSHDGSDYHARQLFDKIEELLDTKEENIS